MEISIDREDYGNYNKSGKYGLVAQLGAHRIRIAGVGSSNLLESTRKVHHQKVVCFFMSLWIWREK